MLKPLICSTAALAVLATAACGPRAGSGPDPAQKPAVAAVVQPPALAAAEPFEALAETAFGASPRDLTAAVAKAEAAAAQVRHSLSADADLRLQQSLDEMQAAHQANNRADLALAAVEGYRTLVSAAPRAKVPVGVSLLDYAGFRYQADLRAQPARWPDMAMAVAFARTTWSDLAPQVADTALKARVDAAVNALDEAARTSDSVRADAAASAELALVDQLEAYFSASRPARNVLSSLAPPPRLQAIPISLASGRGR